MDCNCLQCDPQYGDRDAAYCRTEFFMGLRAGNKVSVAYRGTTYTCTVAYSDGARASTGGLFGSDGRVWGFVVGDQWGNRWCSSIEKISRL